MPITEGPSDIKAIQQRNCDSNTEPCLPHYYIGCKKSAWRKPRRISMEEAFLGSIHLYAFRI